MNQLTDKEKKLLFLLLLVAVSVVCIRFILIPSITSYEDLKVQVQQGQDQLAELKLRLAQGEQIQGQIEEVTTKAQEASKPFFTVATQEEIQQWIIKEAKKANLSLSALTISLPTPEAVTPYTVEARSQISYPIGQFYNEISAAVGSEVGETPPAEGAAPPAEGAAPPAEGAAPPAEGAAPLAEGAAPPAEGAAPPAEGATPPTEGTDQVVKTTINMTFTAQQGDFVRFLNTVKQMDKHLVIENVPMDSFKEEAGDVSLTLAMYSIHKEDDMILQR